VFSSWTQPIMYFWVMPIININKLSFV